MALAMIEAEVISALERPYLLAKDCRSPPPPNPQSAGSPRISIIPGTVATLPTFLE